MLDNTITLPVDEADDAVIVNTAFTRFDTQYANRSIYTGPDYSLINKDFLGFYRVPVKPSGNFNGTAKTSMKLTMDQTVPGVDTTTTIVQPMIGEINFSVPVGATDQLKLRQRMVALLQDDDIWDRLVNKREI